jgi:hypothetical protein
LSWRWILVLWVLEDRHVSDWEFNGGWTDEVLASLHFVAHVVVPEETPSTDIPAAEHESESFVLLEPVPYIPRPACNKCHFLLIFKKYIIMFKK